MSIDYRKIYYNDNFNLARLIVIKSEESANLLNRYIISKFGNAAVDLNDPSTWKYYLNISGDYHPLDTIMEIISPINVNNSNNTIQFNKVLLQNNPDIWNLYQYGTRYYYDLVNRYPLQEQLILGMLYPVDINKAIIADNYTILNYPKNLVEPQEGTLIQDLQNWIYNFQTRRNVRGFIISDNLYYTAQHAIMYLNIVPKLLNLRLRRMRTNEVHSFHIRQYLASHQNLDVYIDYLTLKQQLFLYRNLLYIEHNAGKKDTFKWLIDKLLTDINIPLVEYNSKHKNHYDSSYYNDYIFETKYVNNTNNSVAKIDIDLIDILNKEINLTRGNSEYITNNINNTDLVIKRSLYGNLKTKVLESNMIDYSDGLSFSLYDVMFNHWGYLSLNNLYTSFITINTPKQTESIILTVQDAFLYLIYNQLKILNIDTTYIPKLLFQRIIRGNNISVNDLLEVADKNRIKNNDIPNWIINSNPNFYPLNNIKAFTAYCKNLYIAEINQWLYTAAIQHPYTRAIVENMVARLYCDKIFNYSNGNIKYVDWLNDKGIIDIDYSIQERQDLINNLFIACTGYIESPTKMLKNIQRATINILSTLSSYSVQFVREINSQPLINIDIPATRIGDITGQGNRFYYILPIEEDINTSIVNTLNYNIDTNIEVNNVSINHLYILEDNRDIYVDINKVKDHLYTIPLSDIYLTVDYVNYDPNLKSDFINYESYLNLTDQQKQTIASFYNP